MLTRLAFAVATDVEPEILLADEVFSVGDAEFMQRARQRIAGLVSHSHVVVIVSHQMEHIRRMCDRVIWMDKGRIVLDGAPEEVIAAYGALNAEKQESGKDGKQEGRQCRNPNGEIRIKPE